MSYVRTLLGAALLASVTTACHSGSPQVGSQTNWLEACETAADCGGFDCLCGTCTVGCADGTECGGLDGATCVSAADERAVAVCDGRPAPAGMCLPSCAEVPCPEGTACVAGVCAASRNATFALSVDPAVRHQTLIGFGASLAHDEDFIVQHPDKARLFDAMFAESGFDVVRMRNRFDGASVNEFEAAREIVGAAAARLGQSPTLFLTSGSPPAPLKANGDRLCSNSDVGCTLARAPDGGFDYAGFAEYWRASLEAHAAAGLAPDFVSIQNNVDWIPEEEAAFEACRLLPREGTGQVTTPDGQVVEAEFAGYAEAIAAVSAALSSLSRAYAVSGPEVGSAVMMGGYADVAPDVDALSYHLYGMEPHAVSSEQLDVVRTLGATTGKPILQTEMQAGGLDTAILAHYALAVADSAVYLQQQFVSTSIDQESSALIGTDGSSVEKLPPYHALSHFARATEPGWQRVDTTGAAELLASAWMSPDDSALTIVLVNPGESSLDVAVTVLGGLRTDLLDGARITRTVFDGVERSADLGTLAASRVVRVPGRSIVTVAAPGG